MRIIEAIAIVVAGILALGGVAAGVSLAMIARQVLNDRKEPEARAEKLALVLQVHLSESIALTPAQWLEIAKLASAEIRGKAI